MEKVKISKGTLIAGIISSILLLSLIFYGIYSNMKLKQDPKYTNAVIMSTYYPAKGGPNISYEFYVNHKKYAGSGGYTNGKDLFGIGDSCLIMYQQGNPSNSRLVKDINGRIKITKPHNRW